jgi:hypothetical protein
MAPRELDAASAQGANAPSWGTFPTPLRVQAIASPENNL